MELHEALAQITEIRARMARSETFRGYRSASVAASGVLALAGAAAQAAWLPRPMEQPSAYLTLWVVVAAVSAIAPGIELAYRCLLAASPLTRQVTRLAVEQFLPCLVAGALLTAAIAVYAPGGVVLLPGLWAIVFSLGVFASCRLLPRMIFWAGVYYLVAGVAVLAFAREDAALSPWAMVATFGVGQLLCAAILYFTLERGHARQ